MPCQGLSTSIFRLGCVRTKISDINFVELGKLGIPSAPGVPESEMLIDSYKYLLASQKSSKEAWICHNTD